MPFTTDIAATYRGPGKVVRRMVEAGPREDRALAILMAACAIMFVAQWPVLSRQSHIDGTELNMALGGALMGWIFIAPLVMYLVALIAHLVARAFRGQGASYKARISLFWSLLAASPLFLLLGLTVGFVGEGLEQQLVGVAWFVVFAWFWVSSMLAVYREADA